MPANPQKLYIETYGCQMNVSDSEVAAALLRQQGYFICRTPQDADVILINTCAVREGAERRIWARLAELRKLKWQNPALIIGVMGCMAERLKHELIDNEQIVDIVAGPDAYRNLPHLIAQARCGQKGVNVELSREETYDNITPVRYEGNTVTAFTTIMRGCNNMCSYCVVPHTRGRERSRNATDILREINHFAEQGCKEVTLLGQNVNSYCDKAHNNKGDSGDSGNQDDRGDIDFADLLSAVAKAQPKMRIRFSTSHPKDINDKLLYTMARHANICKHIHLPVQSGSNRILELMNRRYTREAYMDKIAAIRRILPTAAISTDIIAGFCTEREADHQATLNLMRNAGYDAAFMFAYSQRPDTPAERTLKDDVPEDIKIRRLNEIIALQNELSLKSKQALVGSVVEVLAEGVSKKSGEQLFGRTSQNMVVVFPRTACDIGGYARIRISSCTSATLLGEAMVERV
jgi:tRNA-2-methylthio-N6-dimethylallyladenosine synthase